MLAPLRIAASRAFAGAGALDPGAQPGDRQRSGRLHDRPRVVEDVLDRRADLVVRRRGRSRRTVDCTIGKVRRADLLDRDAIGEDADAIEHDAAAHRQRLVHRVGLEGLDADHVDLRAQRLDVAGDAGDQAAAADRHEDRVDRVPACAAGSRARPSPVRQSPARRRTGGRSVRPVDAPARRSGAWLRCRCRRSGPPRRRARCTASTLIAGVVFGMTISALEAEMLRRERHALRMVAGAGRDHAARALDLGHVRDAVVGAAQLEAEDRLQILPLEQHLVAEAARQPAAPGRAASRARRRRRGC